MSKTITFQTGVVAVAAGAEKPVLMATLEKGVRVLEAEGSFDGTDATQAKLDVTLAIVTGTATNTTTVTGYSLDTADPVPSGLSAVSAASGAGLGGLTVSKRLFRAFVSPTTGFRWSPGIRLGADEKIAILVDPDASNAHNGIFRLVVAD